MKLNEFQAAAVNEPPKDITVSAAAGSGKTQVLGERVLRRISGDNPVDVNRLLIVTFTRAAASEMRSRISRSISQELKTETDPRRRRSLERQLSLTGGADICTIDSFCYRILKQNFFRVPDLPGDFTVGDEGAVRLISSDAMRETVEMFSAALEKSKGGELIPYYEEAAEKFSALYPDEEKRKILLEGFGILAGNYGSAKKANDFISESGRSDYVSYVRDISDVLSSVPNPSRWLEDCTEDYNPEIPFDETRLSRYAAKRAAAALSDMEGKIRRELEEGGLNTKNKATFAATLENLAALERPKTYSQGRALFSQAFPAGGSVAAKDTKKEAGNPLASEVMKQTKTIWSKTGERLFSADENEIRIFRRKIYPVILALCELARTFTETEAKKMLKKKKLSFSVCVSLTLKLLTNPDGSPSETALELRERYDEIYVDEAQDIDPRQLAIFNAVSKGRMFMVGDVKQSIYGFRHAEPEIFNSRPFDGVTSRVITMNLNYRSNNNVISQVNQVFRRLMNKSTMDIDYAQSHEMLHGEDWLPKSPPRGEFIAVTDEGQRYGTYKFETEAQAAADRINELIRSKMPVYDKNTGEIRPVKYGDILVLMRSVKTDGAVMEEILTKNNIPCYFDGGESLFFQRETATVIDALSLVDNIRRDIPLAGVLRSLMFGFTENDLLKIRAASAADSFSGVFTALSDPKNEKHEEYARRLEDDDLLSRCEKAGESFGRWREAAALCPVSEVIALIINDTDFYSSVGALPAGEKRRANLDLLIDAAREFEAGGSRGLYSFIQYIKKQELTGKSSAMEAKTLSESMNVTRIMTIHKSKGLEAPVVMLVKASKNMRAHSKDFSISTELGFSADYLNEEGGYKYKSPIGALINFQNRFKERVEEIRLLYVAMTRPRELFICTGYFPNESETEKIFNFGENYTGSDMMFLADSYAKMMGGALKNERLWSLRRVSAAEVKEPSFSDKLGGAVLFAKDVVADLNNILGFDYEHAAAERIPAKVSVSELKAAAYDEEAVQIEPPAPKRERLRRPSFAEEKDGEEKISPTELGTAYHAVMENLDFSRSASEQIAALEERGIISPALRKLIKDEKITAFMESPLGQRMKNAERVLREAPFMINVPASEISDEFKDEQDEAVAVQGIIDCLIIDKDGAAIVDFKTDVYSDPAEIAERYKKQLYYYGKAIKMKFSDKKIQKYLYLFFKGDIIEVY